MSSKLVSLIASVLLVQSVYGQCVGRYQQLGAVSSAPAYSLGGCGANLLGSSYGLANSGLLANNAAYGLAGNAACGLANGLGLQQSLDTLSVASGSAAAPGVSLLAENLALAGEVYAQGAAPFLGTVGVSGALPTAGQALVSYSSAPGVGLSSGGCGQGVSAAYVNNALVGNNLGLAGVNNLGLAGVNNLGLAGVNNLGLAGVNNLGLSGLAGLNNVGLVGASGLGLSNCGCAY